jgi:hypothetical protein
MFTIFIMFHLLVQHLWHWCCVRTFARPKLHMMFGALTGSVQKFFIHSFVRSLVRSFTRVFTLSGNGIFTRSLVRSFTRVFTLSGNGVFTRSLVRSFTRVFTLSGNRVFVLATLLEFYCNVGTTKNYLLSSSFSSSTQTNSIGW